MVTNVVDITHELFLCFSRRRETVDLQLVPIAMSFDIRVVAAPPIVNKQVISQEVRTN